MATRILVIMIGALRGGPIAWKSLRRHVLLPLQADLLTVIGTNNLTHPLIRWSQYGHYEEDAPDWSHHLDQLANGSDWSILCEFRPQWLGRAERCQHPAAGAINFVLRARAAQYLLRHSLLYRYDQYIITRADFLYVADHPRLDPSYLWIPEGQDWGGYNDRHAVVSTAAILPYLQIIEDLVRHPQQWYNYLSTRHPPYGWGSENIIYEYLQYTQWSRLVRRYTHPAFLVAEEGVDRTAWVAPGNPMPEVPYPGVLVKYPDELRRAQTVAPRWRAALAVCDADQL
jgi:hypothetical protein